VTSQECRGSSVSGKFQQEIVFLIVSGTVV